MTAKQRKDAVVLIKLLDRGFNLSVPAEEEQLYRDGQDVFLARIQQHKDNGYDTIEAVGLAAIDCLVAFQKAERRANLLLNALENRLVELNDTVSKATTL